jgi:hypothetical protein
MLMHSLSIACRKSVRWASTELGDVSHDSEEGAT